MSEYLGAWGSLADYLNRSNCHGHTPKLWRLGKMLPTHFVQREVETLGLRFRTGDAAALDKYFKLGWTIVLQAWERFDPSLQRLCSGIDSASDGMITSTFCNLYITPEKSRALGLHFDTHDVKIHQFSGSKNWEIGGFYSGYTSRFDRNIARRHNRIANEKNPTSYKLRRLNQGEELEIPSGTLHRAWTESTPSIHGTFGTHRLCWTDVFARFCRQFLMTHFREDEMTVTGKKFHRQFVNSLLSASLSLEPPARQEVYGNITQTDEFLCDYTPERSAAAEKMNALLRIAHSQFSHAGARLDEQSEYKAKFHDLSERKLSVSDER